MPRVSVLMSVYNVEKYVRYAIDSILTQSYTDFEFIILDDGSTDSTPVICADYAAHDSRIIFVPNSVNKGLTATLNQGLALCQGEFVARMDGDDVALPSRFAEQIAYLDTHPQVVLVSGHYHIINADGDILGTLARDSSLVDFGMLFYNYIGGHGLVMFRREAVLQVGGYDELRRYSQDYELWLRLQSVGEIALVPKVWLKLRVHDENISSTRKDTQESISLRDSQQAIYALTGHEISLSDVANLRAFFLEPFPDSMDASAIHRHLKRISMFFEQRNPSKALLVRQKIGVQFIAWTRSVSLQRYPAKKLHIARYAFLWHPIGLLKDIWRTFFG